MSISMAILDHLFCGDFKNIILALNNLELAPKYYLISRSVDF